MTPKTAPSTRSAALKKLWQWSRDPQAWIAGLALLTLLGLSTGSFEPAAPIEWAGTQEPSSSPTLNHGPTQGAKHGDTQVARLELHAL